MAIQNQKQYDAAVRALVEFENMQQRLVNGPTVGAETMLDGEIQESLESQTTELRKAINTYAENQKE